MHGGDRNVVFSNVFKKTQTFILIMLNRVLVNWTKKKTRVRITHCSLRHNKLWIQAHFSPQVLNPKKKGKKKKKYQNSGTVSQQFVHSHYRLFAWFCKLLLRVCNALYQGSCNNHLMVLRPLLCIVKDLLTIMHILTVNRTVSSFGHLLANILLKFHLNF